ncbi:coiled-coil domain-containing protein R3HCC1L, partial [Cloeon dipterum]|uniref:coiled-coil domain-containing protein R3HCC1L n=1 Tax=Cloeon dipterum TaxID=197152 RepID=UPI0032206B92
DRHNCASSAFLVIFSDLFLTHRERRSKLEALGGRFLTLEDSQFLDLVIFDIETFRTASENCRRVLLFPPVNNYRRFLIHKTTEQFAELKTFSVGEGDARRTVVCFVKQFDRQALINFKESEATMAAATMEQKKAPKLMSGVGLYQPPAMRAARIQTEIQTNDRNNSDSRASKAKRPDRQMYVPRARRQETNSPPENAESTPSPPQLVKSPRQTSPTVVTPRKKSAIKNNKPLSLCSSKSGDSDASSCDLTEEQACDVVAKEEKTVPVEVVVQVSVPVENVVQVSEEPKDLPVECNQADEVRCASEKLVEKEEVMPKFVPESCEEDSWESKFDETGDCLDPKALDDLTKTVGKVEISKPASTYSNYIESGLELRDSEFGHVLEIYDFPAAFKTPDLVAVLTPAVGSSDFDLKWVDDTHAMAVFGTTKTAERVLATNHPLLKVRPLSQAIAETRMKAKKCPQFMRPYKPRPETCAAMAKRLVHSALGVRSNTTKEERDKEKAMLKTAREKRRLAQKQTVDAWEGNFGK